jgi:hypothetical protein
MVKPRGLVLVVLLLLISRSGWSYGLNGNLAKAPRFDSVTEFNNKEYGLYKVHTRIDARGFIWVNLDSAETPNISWEEQFEGVDTQQRLQNFNMDDYEYNYTWKMEGKFNWKTLIENYNEVSDQDNPASPLPLRKGVETTSNCSFTVLSLPDRPSWTCTIHFKQETGLRL